MSYRNLSILPWVSPFSFWPFFEMSTSVIDHSQSTRTHYDLIFKIKILNSRDYFNLKNHETLIIAVVCNTRFVSEGARTREAWDRLRFGSAPMMQPPTTTTTRRRRRGEKEAPAPARVTTKTAFPTFSVCL